MSRCVQTRLVMPGEALPVPPEVAVSEPTVVGRLNIRKVVVQLSVAGFLALVVVEAPADVDAGGQKIFAGIVYVRCGGRRCGGDSYRGSPRRQQRRDVVRIDSHG